MKETKMYCYLKTEVITSIIMFIIIWIIAFVSVLFNIKYSMEVLEKEQEINELKTLIEFIK